MADNEMQEMFTVLGIDPTDDPRKDLMHYGVPGMRWGKRKSGGGSSKSSPKLTVKALSNEELKSAITRMKLEQEFIKLATPVPSPGKKAVQAMVAKVAKESAEAYITKGMKDGGDLVKSLVEIKKAAKNFK